MLRNPAGERNVMPIVETLKKYINGNQERKNLLEISSVCIGALDANQKYPHSDLRQECAYPPVHIACRDDAITNKYPYPCYYINNTPMDITTTTWFTTFPWTTTWVTTTTTTTTTIPPPL
ncbi:hypothetical protein PVAND_014397 [Polypedilum vanderplanki]|uniref:Uncharacterized protein n=1 Tax=Polypedilum vanderplanki TaxID=319348 RepID=A0A9J6B9R4_POLVA|nr:hypothetical protein PVAND_014397 [Polypedilum vanderplanki]